MARGEIKPWTDAEDKRLLHMYREGYERTLIAEAFGRPAKTVSERKRKLLESQRAGERDRQNPL